MCAEEPVSTKLLHRASQWYNIFQKLQNWKRLVSTLVHIQALLTYFQLDLSSIQYLFMNFVSKLLLKALAKFFYCVCA